MVWQKRIATTRKKLTDKKCHFFEVNGISYSKSFVHKAHLKELRFHSTILSKNVSGVVTKMLVEGGQKCFRECHQGSCLSRSCQEKGQEANFNTTTEVQ